MQFNKKFCHRHSSIDFLQILFWAATPQISYKHAILLQISRRISIKLLFHDFAQSTTTQRLNLLVFRPVDWLFICIFTYCSESQVRKTGKYHLSALQCPAMIYTIWDLCMTAIYKVCMYLGLFSKGFEDQEVKIPPLRIRRMIFHFKHY